MHNPADDETGAYAEGWRAYFKGIYDNPYEHGTYPWFMWREGQIEAKKFQN